jgi:ABC-type phosphate transport system substrate-binding protein
VKLLTNDNLQTFFTVLTLVATTAAWLFDRYVVRRRRLSYRVHWNRPMVVTPAMEHHANVSIAVDGEEVRDPSVVVLRVENVGSLDIGADDFHEPLEFRFGGRRIVHYEVQETDPPELAEAVLRPGAAGGPQVVDYHPGKDDAVAGGTLRLPAVTMTRKARFKLLVLLAGPPAHVSAGGRIAGGDVVPEGRRGARSRWSLALGGTSLLLGGLLVGLLATRDVPVAVACPAPGPLSITGSSAMYPAMKEDADAFRERCPGALIQVQSTDSGTAIEELVQAGVADTQLHSTEAQRVKLAMTDDYAGKRTTATGLGYWPVGVGVFAVVVNRAAGVTQVSSDQLRRLFAGTLPKWDDAGLGGSDTEVVLVSRDRGGTRDTFANRVLKGPETAPVSSTNCLSRDIPGAQGAVMHCLRHSTDDVLDTVSQTPGAVGYASLAEAEARHDDNLDVVPVDGYFPRKETVADGRYPFWAVEKLARYGPERPPTVRDHFVDYVLTNPAALDVLRRHGFYLCNDPAFLDGEVSRACGETESRPA